MPGQFAITQRADGFNVDAAAYNGDRQEIVNNLEPAKLDDFSVDVATMRATTDPGELGSESLAANLSEELKRIRFAVLELKQSVDPLITQWYETPIAVRMAGRVLAACRLTYTNATTLTLTRSNGSTMLINGAYRLIPNATVTLTNAGLSASSLYYIYAYWTGSALAMVATGTGHITDANSGQEVHSSDGTLSLVGMARTNASSQFSAGLVASWYNPILKGLEARDDALVSVNSATYQERRPGSPTRVEFLSWANRTVTVRVQAAVTGTGADTAELSAGLDGSAVTGAFGNGDRMIAFPGTEWTLAQQVSAVAAEGYHYASQMVASSAVVTFVAARNRISVLVEQ